MTNNTLDQIFNNCGIEYKYNCQYLATESFALSFPEPLQIFGYRKVLVMFNGGSQLSPVKLLPLTNLLGFF